MRLHATHARGAGNSAPCLARETPLNRRMPAFRPLLDWLRRPETAQRLARVALLGFFAWLTGRFWHPYYGFTRFLQMDAASAAATLPELRSAPIFTYDAGYDGHYYAQLAARPLVNDP